MNPSPEDQVHEIEQAAIGLLAIREHSTVELERKLTSRGFESSLIDETLKALVSRGYLDDHRFTEQYIGMRSNKGYGPYRIRKELRERGISSEIISEWLDERDPQWRELLVEVANRKFGKLVDRSNRELGRRARFLEYRGFSPALIRDFLFSE